MFIAVLFMAITQAIILGLAAERRIELDQDKIQVVEEEQEEFQVCSYGGDDCVIVD